MEEDGESREESEPCPARSRPPLLPNSSTPPLLHSPTPPLPTPPHSPSRQRISTRVWTSCSPGMAGGRTARACSAMARL